MDSGDQLASFPACAFSGPRRYTPVYTRRGRGMEEEYSLTGQLCPSGQENGRLCQAEQSFLGRYRLSAPPASSAMITVHSTA